MTDQPRHLSEADADEKAVLLAENKRLSEELAALRGRIQKRIDAAKAEHKLELAVFLMGILEGNDE